MGVHTSEVGRSLTLTVVADMTGVHSSEVGRSLMLTVVAGMTRCTYL